MMNLCVICTMVLELNSKYIIVDYGGGYRKRRSSDLPFSSFSNHQSQIFGNFQISLRSLAIFRSISFQFGSLRSV
jgi:hypothetical protein